MPDVLLEIGTEELPPDFVASGEVQLRDAAERQLGEARLSYESIEVFATPRRLALLVRGLAPAQAPATEERRGPPLSRALADDGTFTSAAVGFARSAGVDPSDLVRRQTDGGEYLYLVREVEGAPAAAVLPEVLGAVASALTSPKTMRWDASGVRFPRPIRWLVALADDEVVPVTFGGLRAGRTTRGHRLLAPEPVDIDRPASYADRLRRVSVIADRDERRKAVRAAATEAASALGGRPVIHEALLDEVTDLVELPTGVAGTFDPGYLELPRDVLITSMESHLRHFAVEDDAGALLPGFVCVSNASADNADVVVRGNARVLRARLEDARFFAAEDAKQTLSQRAQALREVVFHAKLGTLADKSARVRELVPLVADALGLDAAETEAAALAAEVFKADLLTHLVYEFPELQGVVGRAYAKADDVLRERAGAGIELVAAAIEEHYRPRFADDDLPASGPGVALALADRIDTLVGYLGVGLAPSGSEDPFGLRRAATAFAQIALERQAGVAVDEVVAAAAEAYRRQGVELDGAQSAVRALIATRAAALLGRRGIDPLFVGAAAGSDYADLPDLAARAEALRSLHESGRLQPLAVVHERAHNLSADAAGGPTNPDLFEHDAERELHRVLVQVRPVAAERAAARDYPGALEALLDVGAALERFFEDVLVMADDERVRANRLSLLRSTAAAFAQVADFTDIEPKRLQHRGDDDGQVA